MSPTKYLLSVITPSTCLGQRAFEISHCCHQGRMRLSRDAGNEDPHVRLSCTLIDAYCKRGQELAACLRGRANVTIFLALQVQAKTTRALDLPQPPEPTESLP